MWPSGAVAGATGAIPARPAGVGTGWSRGALGPVWEVGRGGDSAGGGVRRWQASAGTGAPAPVSSRSWQENGRRAQLYGILGEAPGASAGSEGEWSDGSAAAVLMARWRALWRVVVVFLREGRGSGIL
jgi:hypothetical protein